LADIFSTFASRFGGDGYMGLGGRELFLNSSWREGKSCYLCNPVRKGRESPGRGGTESRGGKKRRRKNKIILFGSCEKIPTFALPTETKGKESRNGGCRKDRKKD